MWIVSWDPILKKNLLKFVFVGLVNSAQNPYKKHQHKHKCNCVCIQTVTKNKIAMVRFLFAFTHAHLAHYTNIISHSHSLGRSTRVPYACFLFHFLTKYKYSSHSLSSSHQCTSFPTISTIFSQQDHWKTL